MAHRVLTFCSEDEREKSRQGDPPAVQCSSGVLVFPPAVWGGWLSIPYPARWQWPLRWGSCCPPLWFLLEERDGEGWSHGERSPLWPRSLAVRGEAGILLRPLQAPVFGCRMRWTEVQCWSSTGRQVCFPQFLDTEVFWGCLLGRSPQRCAACEHRTGVLPGCRHPVNVKAGLGCPGEAFLLVEVVHEVCGAWRTWKPVRCCRRTAKQIWEEFEGG